MRMKILVPALSLACLLALSIGGAMGDVSQDPLSGNWLVRTNCVAYNYLPLADSSMTLSQFSVSPTGGAKQVVFASVVATRFNPSQSPVHPTEEGRAVFVRGMNATLETHDNPHAVFVYRASKPSTLTFALDPRIGAVPAGSNALVGDASLLADMAVTNGRTISKSVDNLVVSLQPEDAAMFRVQGPAGSVAGLLSSGALEAELDLKASGVNLDSDLVSYRTGASIVAGVIGDRRASFEFSGLTQQGIAAIDLSQGLYASLRDHLTVSVGAATLGRFADVEDLAASSSSGYVLAEGQSYTEILVRAGSSSGTIVIESVIPGMDWFAVAAALAAVAVSVAAAVYLFRRKGQ